MSHSKPRVLDCAFPVFSSSTKSLEGNKWRWAQDGFRRLVLLGGDTAALKADHLRQGEDGWRWPQATEKSPVLDLPTAETLLWDLIFICPLNLPGINLAKLILFFFLRQSLQIGYTVFP